MAPIWSAVNSPMTKDAICLLAAVTADRTARFVFLLKQLSTRLSFTLPSSTFIVRSFVLLSGYPQRLSLLRALGSSFSSSSKDDPTGERNQERRGGGDEDPERVEEPAEEE
jgi:hypothetical protein